MLKVSVKNLTVQLSDRIILNDISFDINSNSIVGVVGSNGAGKTTLLKTLCGLLLPSKGDIIIESYGNIFDIPSEVRSQVISWLPTNMYSPFDFSVFKLLLLGRYPIHKGFPSKTDTKKVFEILDLLQISDLTYKNINELSSGEQQKVWIGRALVTNPKILVLDEPFFNLDYIYSFELIDIFKELASTGKIIILSLHNIHIGLELCSYFLGIVAKKILIWNNKSIYNTLDNLNQVFQTLTFKSNLINIRSFNAYNI